MTLILLGHLNDWETGHTTMPLERDYLNLFNNLGFIQVIAKPTHNKGKILDILLTNSPQCLSEVVVEEENKMCLSDHLPISFKIKANVKRNKSSKRKIHNFKKADWEKLNDDISKVNWEQLLNSSDVEVCWTKFCMKFWTLVNKHVPTVTIKSDFQPPWFDAEVFAKCREKEKWHKKYKKSKSLNHGLKFKNARTEVKCLIKAKMQSNFSDEYSENAITKKFWSYVKSTSNSHRIPESIYYNARFRSAPVDQANMFNEFFYKQFSCQSDYNIPVDYSKNFNINFNTIDIQNYLVNLDPNKCPGPDKIHGMILKKCAASISLPLKILFQTSYYTCKIPKEWKLAHIVPVHKKGLKNAVENYRPISLTSLVMKVYERVIRADLMQRVEHKLEKRQHGFLPNKSCESQLIPFYDNLACTLNKSSRTDVIYFDFAKAFDSVNHDIILSKLKRNFNIDGLLLKFFVEYLSSRTQKVVVSNECSTELPVLSGVPQGSILGPLLFVIFINDIGNGLSKNSQLALYADDTKLYREIILDIDHELLQNDINILYDWSIKNKMKFHPNKCKVLTVSLQRTNNIYSQALPFSNFIYCLGDTPIDFVNSEKDLGVYINSSLTWTEHCDFLYSKANRMFGLLKRTCHFVKNRCQRRSLYLAMIRSQFEHCSNVWAPSSVTTLNKLEGLQKRAVKWIMHEEYHSYSDEVYFVRCKELDLMPLKFRFKMNDLKLLHKILNRKSQISLPQYIKFHNGQNSLRSSHLDELSLISDIKPKISKNYPSQNTDIKISTLSQFANSYFYRSINYWNPLPIALRRIANPTEFQNGLIKCLWEQARPDVELETNISFENSPQVLVNGQ